MSAPRLGDLARALATAGRAALPAGAQLTEIELCVPVSATARLEPALWHQPVAGAPGCWARLRQWLGGAPPPPPRWISLRWRGGEVSAALLPGCPA